MPQPQDVFPWTDDIAYKDCSHVAAAARAMVLMEQLYTIAEDRHVPSATWTVTGLGWTAAGLARAGDLDALAALLCGLEALVPAEDRKEWPLHELVEREAAKERVGPVLDEVRRIINDGDRD